MAWKWSSIRDDSKCLSLCVCRMEWRFHETGWATRSLGLGGDQEFGLRCHWASQCKCQVSHWPMWGWGSGRRSRLWCEFSYHQYREAGWVHQRRMWEKEQEGPGLSPEALQLLELWFLKWGFLFISGLWNQFWRIMSSTVSNRIKKKSGKCQSTLNIILFDEIFFSYMLLKQMYMFVCVSVCL